MTVATTTKEAKGELITVIKALTKKLQDKNAVRDPDREKEFIQKAVDEAVSYRKAIWAMDDGSLDAVDEANPNELIVRKSKDEDIIEFQKWNDDVYFASRILKQHPAELNIYKEGKDRFFKSEKFAKALSTTATGLGTEFLPTEMSAQMKMKVELILRLAAVFERPTMPTKTWELPVLAADPIAFLASESTTDAGTNITVGNLTSRKVTLVAIKLAVRQVLSEELIEDNIVPALPLIQNRAARAIGDAIEKALTNGDTAATHQDADVTTATDAQKAWNGLRKLTKAANKFDLSTMNTDNLLQLKRALKKYGAMPRDTAWLVSPAGVVELMKLKGSDNAPLLLDPRRSGVEGAIDRGVIGTLLGAEVIVSEAMKDTLDATGVVGNTTAAKTGLLYFNKSAFTLGDRRKMTTRVRTHPDTDQRFITTSWRGDFKPYFDETTEDLVAFGFNLATT